MTRPTLPLAGPFFDGSNRHVDMHTDAFAASQFCSPVNPLDRLRAHPASSTYTTMDPTPKGPVEYVLVHKHPAWLLPVRNDRRNRSGAEYQPHFTSFTADVKAQGVQQPVIAVAAGDSNRRRKRDEVTHAERANEHRCRRPAIGDRSPARRKKSLCRYRSDPASRPIGHTASGGRLQPRPDGSAASLGQRLPTPPPRAFKAAGRAAGVV